MMKQTPSSKAILAVLAFVGLVCESSAQTFAFKNDDLALGFRKTGVYQENYEVVVNIGQASNYVNAASGTTFTVPHFSSSQLVPDSFSSMNNLSWSVVGFYQGTNYSGYPLYTLWVTIPRSSTNVQTLAPTRQPRSTQQTIKTPIGSIFSQAVFISGDIGISNADNNVNFVRESIANYSSRILSVYMGGTTDNTQGTLQDTVPVEWPGDNLENTTSGNFNSAQRSDLYEVRPSVDQNGNPIIDPHTGTSASAYYVGYFQLNANGTMTFTRATATAPLPPPPVLSIARSAVASTISFTSSNSAIYTLYYTNSAGLAAPVSTWPSSPTTITGDGSVKSFMDTSSDPMRVYRVGAH